MLGTYSVAMDEISGFRMIYNLISEALESVSNVYNDIAHFVTFLGSMFVSDATLPVNFSR